jgi:hypothetical protein
LYSRSGPTDFRKKLNLDLIWEPGPTRIQILTIWSIPTNLCCEQSGPTGWTSLTYLLGQIELKFITKNYFIPDFMNSLYSSMTDFKFSE